MSARKLYVVRMICDQQAVGIFYAASLNDLIAWVDTVTEPGFCEYMEVTESGGFVWTGHTHQFGVARDYETPAELGTTELPPLSVGEREVAELMADARPEGGLETFFDDDQTDGMWEYPIEGDDIIRDPAVWTERQNKTAKLAAAELNAQNEPKAVQVQPPVIITTNVYFIGCGDHVKIGIANSVEKRLKTLATGHHQELTLLAVIKDAPGEMEIELHQRFADDRVRGEWFKLSPDIQAFIDEVKAKG